MEIDGAHGEGGGQLLRTAVALAAITQCPLVVRNIRARRSPPGMAPQHLLAVRAVAALCDAEVEGLELRSQTLRFTPHTLHCGTHRFEVGTAGSVTLVLQALLPVMVASRQPVTVSVTGGTDVRQAPAMDYFAYVILPLLAHMGIEPHLEVTRRGYYPRGGGEVRVTLAPVRLTPLFMDATAPVVCIEGRVHVANLPAHVATRMRDAALGRLSAGSSIEPRIAVEVLDSARAVGAGGAVVVWARTTRSVIGAGRVAERGVPAEVLGAAVGGEVIADMTSGATVDMHAADQLLIYLAMAGDGSYLTRSLTSHARTAVWLIEQFLPVRFCMTDEGGLVRVGIRRT